MEPCFATVEMSQQVANRQLAMAPSVQMMGEKVKEKCRKKKAFCSNCGLEGPN